MHRRDALKMLAAGVLPTAALGEVSAGDVTDGIRVKFYDVHARLLAPDLAFAAYWMRTDKSKTVTHWPRRNRSGIFATALLVPG